MSPAITCPFCGEQNRGIDASVNRLSCSNCQAVFSPLAPELSAAIETDEFPSRTGTGAASARNALDSSVKEPEPRDTYSWIEVLWIPLVGGTAVTVVALTNFGKLMDVANQAGKPVWVPIAAYFAVGAIATLPLMLYDIFVRPWLRNLVLWLGIMMIVFAIVFLVLQFGL